jgi:hypothetical protein
MANIRYESQYAKHLSSKGVEASPLCVTIKYSMVEVKTQLFIGVNKTTCFGLLRGHLQVYKIIAKETHI